MKNSLFLTFKTKSMQHVRGILIPIGGNENKGNEENEMYRLEFIDDGILYHVVKEAEGIKASIVIIPTASSIPIEVRNNYIEAFTTLGCENISVLDPSRWPDVAIIFRVPRIPAGTLHRSPVSACHIVCSQADPPTRPACESPRSPRKEPLNVHESFPVVGLFVGNITLRLGTSYERI